MIFKYYSMQSHLTNCIYYFARSRQRSIAISLSTMYTMYWICVNLHWPSLLAGKWPDRHQTCTRWSPGKSASTVCSSQSQRSRDTGTFVLARKSLLQVQDYWDTWNYSLFASSLQSTISCISIQFARWQHDCGRSLLSTIALFTF